MIYKLFRNLYFYSGLYWINKGIKSFLAGRINFLLLSNYSVYGGEFIYGVFGLKNRIKIGKSVNLNNAILNVNSGNIIIGDYVFCGHNVCIITGTHDYTKFGEDRGKSFPKKGNDIIVEEGVWIGTNVTILGPCKIGKNSVIAAGAVVTKDIPPLYDCMMSTMKNSKNNSTLINYLFFNVI